MGTMPDLELAKRLGVTPIAVVDNGTSTATPPDTEGGFTGSGASLVEESDIARRHVQ